MNHAQFWGGGGAASYQIEQSLRFDGSSYLSRTPASDGNRRTWTISVWVKYAVPNGEGVIWMAGPSSYEKAAIKTGTPHTLFWGYYGGTFAFNKKTVRQFRDPSAWMHFVFVSDTSNATASERKRVYINGVRETSFNPNQEPSQNFTGYWNQAVSHRIGADANPFYFNGYMAEVHHVDGQALDPTTFGEYNADGVWVPKDFTGPWGNNGFYLKFDPSATNGIGHDHSGNGNNFSPSGFTTTGTGTDVFNDTPTNNWVTWNPVYKDYKGNYIPNYSEGNLSGDTAGNASHFFATQAIQPGDTNGYYFEITADSIDIYRTYIGLMDASGYSSNTEANAASYQYDYKAILDNAGVYFDYASGTSGASSGGQSVTSGSYSNGDTIMVAYKNGSIWFGKNGTWLESGNPGAGTNAVATDLDTSIAWTPYAGYNSSYTANFGGSASGFQYTVPTGFVGINTANRPAPDIADGSANFNTVLYTGTGTTNARTDVGFQPDLTWIKIRSTTSNHAWYDAIRGSTKVIGSSAPDAESTDGSVTPTSTGFTLGSENTSFGSTNGNGYTYVAWNWLAANGTSTPSGGSIASTVSANPSAGFSIVSYTGNNTAGATVAHGLGVAPDFIVVKNRDSTASWQVYHSSLGATKYLNLDSNTGVTTSQYAWNNTEPTSTVFEIGTGVMVNTSSVDYVAYCFAEVEGYSKFGSYTGNGATSANSGPFVYLGFKPSMVIIKRTDGSGGGWGIWDNKRNTYNIVDNYLFPDTSGSEADGNGSGWWNLDFLSNGFRVQSFNESNTNASGGNYIYMAFAENPFGGSGVSPATAR
jgi:hypothetical protein